jgi:radical SAM/Cys-rich protein
MEQIMNPPKASDSALHESHFRKKFPQIKRGSTKTLQVNLGYKCNQTCVHCHVNAGPKRKEMMDSEIVALIAPVLKARNIQTLDLTGGAPELHEEFRRVVREARALGVKVIDRCNLTILFEPGQEDLAAFLAEQQVEVVASLPCYSEKNVNQQRGDGVFDKSIAALQKLNALGYGKPDSGLVLNLVFNPQGPSLPPSQAELEADYKRELKKHFDIDFNNLFTITNMPINRFAAWLKRHKKHDSYIELLEENHQDANLETVMCRLLLSVDWQGRLYDCDFNQQLGLPIMNESAHLRDLLRRDHENLAIRVAPHCFACTAGSGSSCGGALSTGSST